MTSPIAPTKQLQIWLSIIRAGALGEFLVHSLNNMVLDLSLHGLDLLQNCILDIDLQVLQLICSCIYDTFSL